MSNVVIHSLHQKGSWIWRPQTLEVFSSADGINFSVLGLTDDFLNTTKTGNGTMTVSFNAIETKFIKVKITNWGEIPTGEAGAGNKAWLFVDEIEDKLIIAKTCKKPQKPSKFLSLWLKEKEWLNKLPQLTSLIVLKKYL